MVGDEVSDLEAGTNAGLKSSFLVSSPRLLRQRNLMVYKDLWEVVKTIRLREMHK
jgi:histidinol phosphatase-like enzyme